MKRRVTLVLLFLIVFLVGLVISLPASHAWNWAGRHLPGEAYGLHGTLWEGRASTIIVEGHRLDGVHWELTPASLLRGSLDYEISGTLADGRIRGRVRAGLDGRLRVEDLRLNASADQLVRMASNRPLPLQVGGQVDAYFQEVVINRDGAPERIQGLINWVDGYVVFGDTYDLGDYAIRLDSHGQELDMELVTVDALLRVDGNARLDPVSGQVTGEVIFQTLEGASADLVQGIRFTGLPEPEAENHIRFTGNINNPMGFRGEIQ